MLPKTNIEEKLVTARNKRVSPNDLLDQVRAVLQQNELERTAIVKELESGGTKVPELNIDLLEADRIYQLEDIKKLCITYRLRFLDANYFKGEFPEEAISKIRQMEMAHQTGLSGFKVVAPSKLLKLENADDPLLFVPIGNDYFYLIHKWGNDLSPARKWLMWPYKNFENLIFVVFLLSVLLTAIFPMEILTKKVSMQEYLMLFLFMFKAVGGIVLYYGFAKGKNFNEAIWNSRYYNA
jgi:hypothetical protein